MKTPSGDFIDRVCRLYGDRFDDTEEDAAPGGLDWVPGQKAHHKSLCAFQRELEGLGIRLSTGKIRKILITGDCWSTESSREVGALYEGYLDSGLSAAEARRKIIEETGLSAGMITMLLPYGRVVYNVPGKSSNAVRCDRSRKKRMIR